MRDLSLETEEKLVFLCKKEDQKAFEELINREGDYIEGWIRKFAKHDDALSKEVYQITLIKGWQRIKSFKGNCKFSTWMNTIARNNFYDIYRSNSKRKFVSTDYLWTLSGETDVGVIESHDKKIQRDDQIDEHKKVLQKIFSRIKPEHSEILRMYHSEDMSYAEIAKAIDKPIGTVMSRLHYARRSAASTIKKLKLKNYIENFV